MNILVPPKISSQRAAGSARGGGRLASGAVWLRVAAALAVLAVWWLASVLISGDVVPSPLVTAERLAELWRAGDFLGHVGHTLRRVGLGMLLTVALAIMLGVAMGRSRRAELFFDMPVLVGRTIPGLAWALMAVMVVGLNERAPVLAVVLTATPLVTVQIWEATKALDRDLFEMARVFRVAPADRLRHIVLPALAPEVVAGIKLGLSLGWQVVVLAELLGLGNGVGYQINESFSNFDVAGVLAWTLAFSAIMAFIEYGLIGALQRRMTRWRPTTGIG